MVETFETNNPEKMLNKLIELAEMNRDEDWEMIDKELEKYFDEEVFLDWARNNTDNEVSGLRDLAASILEEADCELGDSDIENLKDLMRENNEENPYPGFRAACALAKRHNDGRVKLIINEVVDKLKNFIQDDNVADIAKEYLRKIENE